MWRQLTYVRELEEVRVLVSNRTDTPAGGFHTPSNSEKKTKKKLNAATGRHNM